MRMVALLCVALCGCSALFGEPVQPGWTPATEPRCRIPGGAVLWDIMAVAGGLVSGGVAFAVSADHDHNFETNRPEEKAARDAVIAMAVTSAMSVVAFGTSSVWGLRQAGKCKRARQARDAYVRRLPATP